MKKIAFHIQKGGVGKTTISSSIANFLARKGEKTILVDCDPNQGSASTWLLQGKDVDADISDVLLGKVSLQDGIIKIEENLWLLPCIPFDSSLRESIDPKLQKAPFLMEDFCEKLAEFGFHFAIFDLSPAFALWEQRLLLAMDEVVTPLSPEFFSLDGISIFQHEFQELNKANRKQVKHNKIVCNMVNKSFKRHLSFLESIRQLDFQIFEIGQDAQMANAQFHFQSIFDFAPESKSIPEITRLGEALWQQDEK